MPVAHPRTQMSQPRPAASESGARPHWSRTVVQVLLKLAYPALILCAWRWDAPRLVGGMLLVTLWLQRWAGGGPVAMSLRQLSKLDWSVVAMLSCASATIVVTDSELLLRFYPSLVNLGLLIAFGATLVRGPSMIEKFARLGSPDLPPGAVRYTRRVTQVWCVFFVLNGAFSVYTALYWSRAAWSLYNGAIAYGLIGALLAGEYVWRRLFVLPRAARADSEAA
ncbi:hypothetical protein [Paraburkholderia sp. MM5384-R2]|uniref:COG4648 family protein n=1 Tax=Paraburkholderia sp. MM5384-R2 TaxID=2723097 RepID=UPI001611E651